LHKERIKNKAFSGEELLFLRKRNEPTDVCRFEQPIEITIKKKIGVLPGTLLRTNQRKNQTSHSSLRTFLAPITAMDTNF